MPLQKPKAFSFTANTGDKFTIYGESVEQALMSHLCTCTKVVGHQLTSAEAKNPDVIIMIAPDEFLRYFTHSKTSQRQHGTQYMFLRKRNASPI